MRKLVEFLHDDSGSATVWNLFWLLNFGALMGLAIDTTAAMNLKARLQEASDAASSAAVIDVFPVASGATPVAMQYAEMNLRDATAVQNQDVFPGFWDHESRTFRTEDIPYANAVRVIARRDTSRGNALGTVLLHIVGFNAWDISAASISAYAGLSAVDRCRTNGLLADGLMSMTSNNTISGDYCMHGETEFKLNNLTTITCGAELSTPEGGWKTGTPPSGNPPEICDENYNALTTEEMIEQSFVYRSAASHARAEYFNVKKILDAFVNGAQVNDPFHAIPPYITTVQFADANTIENRKLDEGTLYVVACGANGKLTLRGIIQNVGFYTDCVIDVNKDQNVSKAKPTKTINGYNNGNTDTSALCDPDTATCDQVPWDAYLTPRMTCDQAVAGGYETYRTYLDTAPGNTYRDDETVDTIEQDCGIEPGANGLWDNVFVFTTSYENGDHSKSSVIFPNNMQIGRMDGCTEGGGVRIYAGGSVNTPSGTMIHGSQFVLLGNSAMAAKADGVYGTTVNAAGDITFAAQGEVGGCPAEESALASDVIATVRPVMIVD